MRRELQSFLLLVVFPSFSAAFSYAQSSNESHDEVKCGLPCRHALASQSPQPRRTEGLPKMWLVGIVAPWLPSALGWPVNRQTTQNMACGQRKDGHTHSSPAPPASVSTIWGLRGRMVRVDVPTRSMVAWWLTCEMVAMVRLGASGSPCRIPATADHTCTKTNKRRRGGGQWFGGRRSSDGAFNGKWP